MNFTGWISPNGQRYPGRHYQHAPQAADHLKNHYPGWNWHDTFPSPTAALQTKGWLRVASRGMFSLSAKPALHSLLEILADYDPDDKILVDHDYRPVGSTRRIFTGTVRQFLAQEAVGSVRRSKMEKSFIAKIEAHYVVTGKKWIQKAIKKPGSLKKQLGVKKGAKIPVKKLRSASKKGGKLGKRARLALTLRGLKK